MKYLILLLFLMGFFTSSSFATPEYSKGIDYSTSSLGDNEFIVSGMVDTIIENVQVTMSIMDSNGKIIFIAQAIPDENRHFAFDVTKKGPLWQNVTDYSIIVNYQKPDANSEFYGRNIGSSDGVFRDIIEIPKVLLSPLKQFKSGIPIDEIQCKENLQLVIKASDGSPACVKSGNKTKLLERGWTTKPIHESDQVTITGDDAWAICGALRLPCPSNPVFSGTLLDDNIIIKISGNGDPYEVKLNQTSVCVTSPSKQIECSKR